MNLKRWQFMKAFELQMLREIEAEKRAAQAAREHQIHPTMINKWQKQQEKRGEGAPPTSGRGDHFSEWLGCARSAASHEPRSIGMPPLLEAIKQV
jgi:transposase-like protein